MSELITRRDFIVRSGAALSACTLAPALACHGLRPRTADAHLLYVAVPGVRNYTEWGGIGVLVYDIADGFRFVRRIPTMQPAPGESPEAVKGICASAVTGRAYVSTPKRLLCVDLSTDALLWNRTYAGGCDRMAITPDGRVIYLPSFEGPHWNVVDAETGEVLTRIVTNSGAHNTICGADGARAYLAGLGSPLLRVVDTQTRTVVREVGPFGGVIRPFTVDAAQERCYVNVNELLGFEVGDLRTGAVLHRVEVPGFQRGPVKRHGCPSHGVGLTPDGAEVWVCDAANSRVHVFDATLAPPRLIRSIALRDQPGWITFTIDGRFAIPSTGEVIDAGSKRVVTALSDEAGHPVQSEKLLEIVFRDGRPMMAGDQFGLGRLRAAPRPG
jgi:DNA-binding beta-propeller fold protein YncE